MSGIGESLVIDTRLKDLQHMIEIGLISNYDTAKKAYPSLRDDDIQEIFDSLHNTHSNQD